MLRSNRGFTLVEMMIVILLMGLMLAFAVPALRRLGNSQGLKGARDNMVSQLQIARARAISTGVKQPIHFYPGTYGFDYHLHPVNAATSSTGWMFPNGVTYETSTNVNVEMMPDGRAQFPLGSSSIAIKNLQGQRDTVYVLASGLVIAR